MPLGLAWKALPEPGDSDQEAVMPISGGNTDLFCFTAFYPPTVWDEVSPGDRGHALPREPRREVAVALPGRARLCRAPLCLQAPRAFLGTGSRGPRLAVPGDYPHRGLILCWGILPGKAWRLRIDFYLSR